MWDLSLYYCVLKDMLRGNKNCKITPNTNHQINEGVLR
jgi:hypothetical protein